MRGLPPKLIAAILLCGVFVLAVVLYGPSLWHQYLEALARRSAPLYAPREKVAGGNEPLAPRVDPALELLDPQALEAAARYAGAHGSRALIVARHDHIVYEHYWQGTSFDTVSDAQSFTPLLAALATGVAISHRRIGWPDEPLSLLLKEWNSDPRGTITVRNLLQHSSGLAPEGGPADVPDLAAAALSAPQAGAPGVTRLDQASDAQLLALVLERTTGQGYADYVSGTLWRRLGAADAWFWLDHPGGTPHADCCMFARQGDWIRVGQMLVRDGTYRGVQVIRPGWVSFMRTPAKSDPDFGSFVRIAARPAPGAEAYAASDLFVVAGRGGNRLWLVPSMQLVILCTGPASGRDGGWEDARIPNMVMQSAHDYQPPATQPGADLSSVVPGH
jgi:CubicO group peptidase (beta-lactamase class C family)